MFDIGRNTTTLSKFIGCIDLIDFHQISPKHPRNNDKGKCVEKFWYLKYLSCGVHLRNTSQIFLASLTLDADINSTNQNIKKAGHTLVDWCLVNEAVQPFCSCSSIWCPINSIGEPLVALCLTGFWHFLKEKLLNLYFYSNLHLLSFPLIYSFQWFWLN